MSKPSVWDRLEKVQPKHFTEQVKAGTGFTLREYRERYGSSYQAARYRMVGLLNAGKIKALGYRGKEIVYDVV